MLRIRSLNVRGSYRVMVELGDREDDIDIYCLQEVAVGVGEKFYIMDGYEVIGGVGGFIEKEEGSVVGVLAHERWKGKYVVMERSQWRIGIRVELGGGKEVSVWNIYLGQGKHDRLERMDERESAVWIGDFNEWSKRWDGEKERRNKKGRMVEEWMNE